MKYKRKQKHRSKDQKNALHNIEMLYKATNKVVEFFDDYSSMASETKLKAIKGTGIKMLTSKQMLQRFFVYSLCQSKEITKKVYNNTTKSTQI